MSETDQLALYRLWRPQNFSEVVAQEQIVYPLRQSVINGNFSHALLFSGTRGTGKTSLAKIFAKAINCLNPDHGDPCNACEICLAANDGSLMDISEIDAASHNSVDHMRRLTDEVAFTPLKARFKVYIIDEVHMLSVGAFNALLKTLEEPPSHAVFVMATTEPHRIPATIISRCQHFKFRRIPNDEIIERIRLIAKSIDLAVDESAFEMMATLSGGALRDAIGLLDQTRQLETTPITRDDVLTLAGLVPDRFLSETAEAILFKKPDVLLVNIQELVMSGRDLTRFVTDFGAYFRNLLVTSVSNKPEQLIQLRGEDIERMTSIAQQTKTSVLTELIAGLSQLLVSMRLSPDLRTTLEIGLIDLLTRFGTEIDITKADHSHEHRKQKASADTQQTDSPQAKPVPATEKSSDTVVETNADIEPHQSGEPVAEDSLRTEPKTVSNNDTLPAEKEKDVDLPSDSDVQSSDTVTTARGEMPVLDIWRAVLDDLQREMRMDIALCARPARIKADGKLFAIHFDSHLKGQYNLISRPDNARLIQQLLTNHVGKKVELRIILDQKHDSLEGDSAEWGWLKQAREQALIEDIPSPEGENE
jgi:DNA polymerase-3 subunit gamma/tau